MSTAEAAALTDQPGWLPWALAVATAASLVTVLALVGRIRRGLPLVAPRPHGPVPWQGSDVLVVLLIGFFAAVVVGTTLGGDPPLDRTLAANLLLMAFTSLAAIAWLSARGATAGDLGFVEGRGREDLGLALTGLAVVVAPLLTLAAAVHALVPYEHPVVELLSARRDPWAVGLVLASALVAAPLAEELFFRRILQGWLENRLPEADGAGAILISSAAFALAHQGQGLAFIPLFPLGLVLGFLARRTGSIVPGIILHSLFNAVSVGILLASPAPGPPS